MYTCIKIFILFECYWQILAIKWLSTDVAEQTTWTREMCTMKKFGFTSKQRGTCRRDINLMTYLSQSAQLTKTQCQLQFRDKTWDCFSIMRAPNYGFDLARSTKESAVVYAMAGAALVHTIAQNCASGSIPNCRCNQPTLDRTTKYQIRNERLFFSRSCPSTVNKGIQFAREFTKLGHRKMKKVREKSPLNAAYLEIQHHNRQVGWKVVKDMKTVKCACRGQTGNCQVRTCYKSLTTFAKVAGEIKKRYDEAVKVTINTTGTEGNKLAPVDNIDEVVTTDELIYAENSAEPCKNLKSGYAINGRWCTLDKTSERYCKRYCCEGKYKKKKTWVESKCNCKFKWCCKIECDTCNSYVDGYSCSLTF